jgi:hypothetical protein
MQIGWIVGVCIHNYIHVDCVLDMNIYHIWLEVSALFGVASFHGDYGGRN